MCAAFIEYDDNNLCSKNVHEPGRLMKHSLSLNLRAESGHIFIDFPPFGNVCPRTGFLSNGTAHMRRARMPSSNISITRTRGGSGCVAAPAMPSVVISKLVVDACDNDGWFSLPAN